MDKQLVAKALLTGKSSSWKPISELRSVIHHMGSHSVTCHLNVPQLNPSQAEQYSSYLPQKDRRLC